MAKYKVWIAENRYYAYVVDATDEDVAAEIAEKKYFKDMEAGTGSWQSSEIDQHGDIERIEEMQ